MRGSSGTDLMTDHLPRRLRDKWHKGKPTFFKARAACKLDVPLWVSHDCLIIATGLVGADNSDPRAAEYPTIKALAQVAIRCRLTQVLI